jgi:hypothetical protein
MRSKTEADVSSSSAVRSEKALEVRGMDMTDDRDEDKPSMAEVLKALRELYALFYTNTKGTRTARERQVMRPVFDILQANGINVPSPDAN